MRARAWSLGAIGLVSGRLSDRLAPHRLVCAGLALFAVAMYCCSTLRLSVSTITLLVMLQRGAFGMIFSASDTAIMHTLPATDRSMRSGLHTMHRGIPTVCLVVTLVVACTYEYDDGRIALTRCAVIAGGLGDRWSQRLACRTPP